jgi:hypothetical protein
VVVEQAAVQACSSSGETLSERCCWGLVDRSWGGGVTDARDMPGTCNISICCCYVSGKKGTLNNTL